MIATATYTADSGRLLRTPLEIGGIEYLQLKRGDVISVFNEAELRKLARTNLFTIEKVLKKSPKAQPVKEEGQEN